MQADTLHEAVLACARDEPLALHRLGRGLRQGKAAFKRAASSGRVAFDPSLLPYNQAAFAAQFLGRGKTGRAAADDNDFIGRPGGVSITRLRCHPFAFLAYEYLAIPLFHRPARERTEGGSAQSFACAQIEASVMPWTTDGVIDHETIGQRPAVMRACRADCEHLVPAAHQQHLLVAAMTDELAAIGEIEQARCP